MPTAPAAIWLLSKLKPWNFPELFFLKAKIRRSQIQTAADFLFQAKEKPGSELPGFLNQQFNLVEFAGGGAAESVGFDVHVRQTGVGVTGIGRAEPAGAVETGNVTTLEEDVTKVGVVGITAVGFDVSGDVGTGTGTGGVLQTNEVSGKTGVSAAVGLAVAFDHTEVGSVAEVGGGSGAGSVTFVGQGVGTGTGSGDGAGAGEDSVVAEVVIAAEDFESFVTLHGVDFRAAAADLGGDVGQLAVGIDGVGLHSGTDLLQVAGAVDTTGLFTGLLQGGQKHTGQDSDDGDNHQQLDQSKSTTLFHFFSSFVVRFFC